MLEIGEYTEYRERESSGEGEYSMIPEYGRYVSEEYKRKMEEFAETPIGCITNAYRLAYYLEHGEYPTPRTIEDTDNFSKIRLVRKILYEHVVHKDSRARWDTARCEDCGEAFIIDAGGEYSTQHDMWLCKECH